MRLNKRKIELPSGRVTQYLLENGKIVAEFHDDYCHNVFALGIIHRTDLTAFDMDSQQVIYGPIGEML